MILLGNNTRKTGTGIRFLNNCNATELHCNVMLDCYHGVYLDNSSQSDQGTQNESWGNYWNNQVDNSWLRIGGNPLNPIRWYYDASVDVNYDPNPHIPVGIQDFSNIPHADCPDPTLVRVEPDNMDEIRDIAYNAFSFDDFQNEMTYSNKEYFYEILKQDTTLMYRGEPEDVFFQLMYNQLRSGNVGLFSDVKELAKNNDFAQALIKNQLIADTNAMEWNKKIVNEISLLNQLNNTEPDPIQNSMLENIAFQFPVQGGEAVYLARAMLHKHVEDQIPLFRKRKKSGHNPLPSSGIIYPNPATRTISYQSDQIVSENETLTLVLTDGLNRQLLSKTVKDNHIINLSVEMLTPGMYYFMVFLNDSIYDKGKLIIER